MNYYYLCFINDDIKAQRVNELLEITRFKMKPENALNQNQLINTPTIPALKVSGMNK